MLRRVVVLVVVLAAARVHAQPVELALAWQAPRSCPDAASVRDRIEHRLGRSLDDMVVGISVDISVEAGRFVARVDLRAVTVANDVRTLTSRRCDELADAVAVIVARVAGERRARFAEERRARVAVREEASTTAHADLRLPARPRRWGFGARLSGVSGIGLIPEVGLGAELAVSVRRRATMAELAETRWMTSAAQIHAGSPARVDVALQVTAARIGWRPEELPLRAWASAETGSMTGTGVGVGNAQVGSGRWVAAGAGFGVAWRMSPWIRLVGTTEVLIAFERVRFTLGDGPVVYAPAPMSARASCGLEVGWL